MPVIHLMPHPLMKQSGCSPWVACGFSAGFKAKFIIQAGALKKIKEEHRGDIFKF